MREKQPEARPGDFWLIAIPVVLTVIGLIYLYSATYQAPDPESGAAPLLGMGRFFKLQVLWFLFGLGVYRLVSRADFTNPPFPWTAIYLPILALLIITIIAGHTAGGSERWINLGLLKMQPSEYAKIAFVLVLAQVFSGQGGVTGERFAGMLGLLGVTAALIVMQPDLGTAIVFFAIFSVILFLAQGGQRFLVAFLVVVMLIAVPGWFLLHDYQRDRVLSFMNPEADIQGAGYNVYQSKIAIGSGGLTGAGLRQGTQTQGGFVPNDHTDFIFSVVGEEGGFVGGGMVILLFALLVLRLTWAGQVAANAYQQLIAYGVSAIIFFQAVVNIGMNMGVLPVTGIPLPFFSYGGNSLFTMYFAIGVCQSIVRNRFRVS